MSNDKWALFGHKLAFSLDILCCKWTEVSLNMKNWVEKWIEFFFLINFVQTVLKNT